MKSFRPALAAAVLAAGAVSSAAAAGPRVAQSTGTSCGSRTPTGSGSTQGLTDATNRLGFGLYNTLAGPRRNTNTFISPVSVELALAMAYDGARGGTQTAMARTLGLSGLRTREVRRQAASLLGILASADPRAQFEIANSLWARAGLHVRQQFLQHMRHDYGARVADLNFSAPNAPATINAWVHCATHGAMDSIVSRIPPDAVMYLINAVYFNGQWRSPFPSAQTHNGPFTTASGAQRTVPLMHQNGTFPYYAGSDFQLLSLPYGDGRFSMIVLLPRAGESLTSFQHRLTVDQWNTWIAQLQPNEGAVALPRFTLANSFSLHAPLARLGMAPAFSRVADFSGICTQRCRLTQVLHKTYLKVYEKGTTATAVTAVTVGTTALRANPFQIVVNHPFFLAIRDSKTGTLLFFGGITSPERR